jgi:hypothetical protein
MQAREPRLWQHFGNFNFSKKNKLILIDAYNEWIQSYIEFGWSAYLVTFMFLPLPGNQNSKIQQMKKEIESFYSNKLLYQVIRRPKFNDDAPILFAFADLPVGKKDKTTTIDALVNEGLHFHAIVLIPPKSRLSLPLHQYVASLSQAYLDQRKLDRIHVQPFYSDKSFRVVDYVLKSMKGRLDYDDCILILPKASSECRDNFSKKQVKTMNRQNAQDAGMNPHNSLSRELTRARQARTARRKPKKPIAPQLHPAEYVPQQILIKKKPS